VDFDAARDGGRSTDQTIGRRSGIGDLEVTAANRRAFGRRPGPRRGNLQRANFDIVGGRASYRKQQRGKRQNRS
jgi:hypothetical protein